MVGRGSLDSEAAECESIDRRNSLRLLAAGSWVVRVDPITAECLLPHQVAHLYQCEIYISW